MSTEQSDRKTVEDQRKMQQRKENNMETETITIVIKNPYPKASLTWTPSRQHMANIIDYCADRIVEEQRWTLGEELSLLFRNGDATALDACQYFIDGLNEVGVYGGDGAFYSLDSDNNLTVTRTTEEEC